MTITVPRCVRWLSRIFLAGAPLLGGCNLLPMVTNQTQEKSEKDVALGIPSKHSFRVSQFVFLHDFALPREAPICKELGILREQVYRDLRLPPSSTDVFVYLFEDKQHYENFIHKKYPQLPDRRAYFVKQARRLGGNED